MRTAFAVARALANPSCGCASNPAGGASRDALRTFVIGAAIVGPLALFLRRYMGQPATTTATTPTQGYDSQTLRRMRY